MGYIERLESHCEALQQQLTELHTYVKNVDDCRLERLRIRHEYCIQIKISTKPVGEHTRLFSLSRTEFQRKVKQLKSTGLGSFTYNIEDNGIHVPGSILCFLVHIHTIEKISFVITTQKAFYIVNTKTGEIEKNSTVWLPACAHKVFYTWERGKQP
jgi:hypothetical protein